MGDHLDPAKLDAHLDRMLQHLYVEVDATDAQKQQLGPIVKAAARDLLPMRDRMRDARLQAVALLSQPSIDRAALEALRAELDQPSVWPRGHAKRRRLQWSWGTVRYRQSWGPSGRNPIIAGVWMKGEASGPPASSSKTLVAGSAERRFASTHPAEPAPTIT